MPELWAAVRGIRIHAGAAAAEARHENLLPPLRLGPVGGNGTAVRVRRRLLGLVLAGGVTLAGLAVAGLAIAVYSLLQKVSP